MAKLYLVRHGRAAAGFGAHADPGLDDHGHAQAIAVAAELLSLGPLPIASSPLARARQTAEPLASQWRCAPRIEPRVAEIPSPTADLAERARWLGVLMSGGWLAQPPELRSWSDAVVACLLEPAIDTVFFSHFIAINVATGSATGDDRVIGFRPDNASVTILDNAGGRLALLSRGREAATRVT